MTHDLSDLPTEVGLAGSVTGRFARSVDRIFLGCGSHGRHSSYQDHHVILVFGCGPVDRNPASVQFPHHRGRKGAADDEPDGAAGELQSFFGSNATAFASPAHGQLGGNIEGDLDLQIVRFEPSWFQLEFEITLIFRADAN